MNIDEVFEMCHGTINVQEGLIAIDDKEIINFIKKENLDPTKFFIVLNSLSAYCYFNKKNGVYIEIYDFEEKLFKLMQVKKKIYTVEDHMNNLLLKKDYVSVFCFMEKKLRINYLNFWYKEIPEDQLLEVFKDVYSSCEYGFEYINPDILNSIQKLSRNELEGFNNEIEIYRGIGYKSRNYNETCSWTLSKNTAEFFANRFKSNGKVLKGKVNKKDIIVYITNRNEEELLIKENSVYDVTII